MSTMADRKPKRTQRSSSRFATAAFTAGVLVFVQALIIAIAGVFDFRESHAGPTGNIANALAGILFPIVFVIYVPEYLLGSLHAKTGISSCSARTHHNSGNDQLSHQGKQTSVFGWRPHTDSREYFFPRHVATVERVRTATPARIGHGRERWKGGLWSRCLT